MARLLTRAQYARKTKYSRARITQLVNQGVIILKNGKVDPAQAEVAIAANIDRSRRMKSELKSQGAKSPQMNLLPNGKGGFNTDAKKGTAEDGFNTDQSNGPPSLTETRRDHELLKMKLTDLELKIKWGELVPKGEATKWVVALGSAAKQAFQNLPKRLAPRIKILTDEKEIEMLLKSEINQIIRELMEKPPDADSKCSRRKNPKGSMERHLEASR